MTDTTMFDSVTVDAYPVGCTMALAYACGPYANVAEVRKRCPHAQVKTICVDGMHEADELDVERGDATPATAPGWIARMRGLNRRPVVYCSRSLIGTVQHACHNAGVAEPFWHVADWTGEPHLWPGSVATQYASPTFPDPRYPGNVDVSVVSPNYPSTYQTKGQPVQLPTLTWANFYRALALAGSALGIVISLGNQLHMPTAVRGVLLAASAGIVWIEHHKVTAGTTPKPPPPPKA